MDNKGQAIFSEYAMIFFVVIAAATAMTVFVQRGLEARTHEERNFMVDSVKTVCDTNCLQATGGTIFHEYEPYYTITASDVAQNQADTTTATQGSAQAFGAIYTKSLNENTQTISTSCQLPPECANISGLPPSECICPGG